MRWRSARPASENRSTAGVVAALHRRHRFSRSCSCIGSFASSPALGSCRSLDLESCRPRPRIPARYSSRPWPPSDTRARRSTASRRRHAVGHHAGHGHPHRRRPRLRARQWAGPRQQPHQPGRNRSGHRHLRTDRRPSRRVRCRSRPPATRTIIASVQLPSPCLAPSVFFAAVTGAGDRWLAVTGFSRGRISGGRTPKVKAAPRAHRTNTPLDACRAGCHVPEAADRD